MPYHLVRAPPRLGPGQATNTLRDPLSTPARTPGISSLGSVFFLSSYRYRERRAVGQLARSEIFKLGPRHYVTASLAFFNRLRRCENPGPRPGGGGGEKTRPAGRGPEAAVAVGVGLHRTVAID